MPIPYDFPQIKYSYGDGFNTILFELIGSCIGCTLIVLTSFLKFRNQNSKP